MFEDFEEKRLDVGEAEIYLRHGGDGPPLLLLHGFPQTHATWHKIAPDLAKDYTVVAPDLRGYGDSVGPPDPEATDYSNRRLAADVVTVMETLGFSRYRVAGHDRGARVGYRLALDHPTCVEKLAVLDIVPTLETVELMDYQYAHEMYHWLFLAQPHPLPETLLNNEPTFYVDQLIESWAADPNRLAPEAIAEYHRCFENERVVRASCEDYRAGLSVDLDHDRASRAAGDQIECPVLALWGSASGTVDFDPLEIWTQWATSIDGRGLSCGHFLMEEAPETTLAELESFLT
ncbi:alpha/beta hydrolase [Natronolimnohabitans sp. A-GB9]|uniref:alpha/beta fold hydrolase n=1 Tax=Natronolimnohabitans sp. A-GB9 TaxID=3069757 RepID=UPI0027B3BE92|nr:alpha/beta hydrolase [Natronolimnohabitans sp. A-GB9]MDQ2052239.1 alpha/beta hydrolase [Natronolimnohabitans sp. A-GB9]